MYLYEIVSPNYEKMWVHSSLKQYIEARPWLLSMLSLSILRPKYSRQTLIHIPGSVTTELTCVDLDDKSVEKNYYISFQLQNLSYYEAHHSIALKSNGTYYHYITSSSGDFEQKEIPFVIGNVAIMI